MVNNSQKYPYDQYTDGRQIMIGDRVAFRTCDGAGNIDLGYVVAMFLHDTKEACDWNMSGGGFLVMMDRYGLKSFSGANEEIRLVARGDDQEKKFIWEMWFWTMTLRESLSSSLNHRLQMRWPIAHHKEASWF